MIFDTDVLIWYLRGDARAVKVIDECSARVASVVSWMELIQGARARAEIRTIRRSLRNLDFRLIPIDEPVSHLAATLMEEHAPSLGLEVADALIAATARASALPLVTGNVRHYRGIPGLEVKAFRPARTSK